MVMVERRNIKAKVGAYTILSSEENCNSRASFTKASLKSKKFDLEKKYKRLDTFSDIVVQSGRRYRYEGAKWPKGLHFDLIPR